jgi:hypothetical protein
VTTGEYAGGKIIDEYRRGKMKKYAVKMAALPAMAALVFLWGCNYGVYGGTRDASVLGDAAGAGPGAVKIGRIINRTTEPRLDDRMRAALAEELMRQGVAVVSSSPNEITAVIKGFSLGTLSEKRKYAAEYSVEIKADIAFKNEKGVVRRFTAVSSPFIESFNSPDSVAGIIAAKELAEEAALKNLAMYAAEEILHGRTKPVKPRPIFASVRIGGVENRTTQEGIDKKLRAALNEGFPGGAPKVEKPSPIDAGGRTPIDAGGRTPIDAGGRTPIDAGGGAAAASSSRTPNELSAVITYYGISVVAGGPDEPPRYEVDITADFTVRDLLKGTTTLIKDVSSGTEKAAKTGRTPEKDGKTLKAEAGNNDGDDDAIEAADSEAVGRLLKTLAAELTKKDDAAGL